MSPESARLGRLRATVAALDGHEWLRASDGECDFVETRQAEGDPPVAIARFTAAAGPEEIDLIAGALDNMRFLLALVDRAIVRLRFAVPSCPAPVHGLAPRIGSGAGPATEGGCDADWPYCPSASEERAAPRPAGGKANLPEHGDGVSGAGREAKNYSAEAAMKCAEPAFRVFLEEVHGLERPLTEARVAQRLRSILAISSRRELNDDEEAAARWRMLVKEFTEWRRGR